MNEVFTEAIQWVNLPFTVLLGVIVLYWCLVALGALDMDMFGGGDLDMHADLDGDMHASHGGGGEIHGMNKDLNVQAGGFWLSTLSFINVGQVPVMFAVSVLVLSLWLGSMLVNHYLTSGSILLAAAFLLPNFLVGLVVTRYATLPFRPLFRLLTKDRDEQVPVLGQRCIIVTSEATPEFGQAEIRPADAPPLLLNVRTMDGSSLRKGECAVVVRADIERGIHFIASLPEHKTLN